MMEVGSNSLIINNSKFIIRACGFGAYFRLNFEFIFFFYMNSRNNDNIFFSLVHQRTKPNPEFPYVILKTYIVHVYNISILFFRSIALQQCINFDYKYSEVQRNHSIRHWFFFNGHTGKQPESIFLNGMEYKISAMYKLQTDS